MPHDFLDDFDKTYSDKLLIYSTQRHNLFSRHSSYVGGLADRIKGIITSYLISIKLGRKFLIDWTNPWPLHPTIQPAAVDWRIDCLNETILNNRSLTHVDAIDKIDIITEINISHLERALFLGADTVVININSYSWDYASSIFSNKPASQIFSEAYSRLFDIKIPLHMEEFFRNFEQLRSDRGSVIGVHLRTGGGNGWNDPNLSDWTEYEEIINSALSEANNQGIKKPLIYFASDSQAAKDAAFSKFKADGLIVSNFGIGHIDRSNLDNRDHFDHAILEFKILSCCDLIFGRSGGYYTTAALAGGKKVFKL